MFLSSEVHTWLVWLFCHCDKQLYASIPLSYPRQIPTARMWNWNSLRRLYPMGCRKVFTDRRVFMFVNTLVKVLRLSLGLRSCPENFLSTRCFSSRSIILVSTHRLISLAQNSLFKIISHHLLSYLVFKHFLSFIRRNVFYEVFYRYFISV